MGSSEFINKYELAHLIGIRALQLEGGEFPASLMYRGKGIEEIAEQDVLSGRCNLAFHRASGGIWRVLPGGRCERIPHAEEGESTGNPGGKSRAAQQATHEPAGKRKRPG